MQSLAIADHLGQQGEKAIRDFLKRLPPKELEQLRYKWEFWARPSQLEPPGDWVTWLLLCGRSFGKTRCGSEWIRKQVCGKTPLAAGAGRHEFIAVIAETAADARDVLVEGPAGILKCHPKEFRPTYEPSKRRLTWPNGTQATLYNGTEPDQLRGPQHSCAWVDEIAKYRYGQETWDMLEFGMRLVTATQPRKIVTTTPRPTKLIKALIDDPRTYVTRGSLYENRANLDSSFVKGIIDKYEGTRLGRQELDGEVLDDVPGALWTRTMLDSTRKKWSDQIPDMQRLVVAIDPAAKKSTDEDESSETGIVVAGLGIDGRGYIIDDRSCRLGPSGWAGVAIAAYDRYEADAIVVETNMGGDMVKSVIQAHRSSIKIIEVTATRGKVVRAEPISALYEQCIAEGQLVETDCGSVPIEQVKAGDKVWTRQGLKPVLWAGITGIKETILVDYSGGTLECTGDHPIYTQRGFINASELKPGSDAILRWPFNSTSAIPVALRFGSQTETAVHAAPPSAGRRGMSLASMLSLTASAITSSLMAIGEAAVVGARSRSFCTAWFGERLTEKFLKAGTFTTLMATPAITSPRILRRSLNPTTRSFTSIQRDLERRNNWLLFLRKPKNAGSTRSQSSIGATNVGLISRVGALLRRVFVQYNAAAASGTGDRWQNGKVLLNLIKSVQLKLKSFGAPNRCLHIDAFDAELSSTATELPPNIAPQNAVCVLGMREGGKRRLVYNLHVQDCHEFFASGILVHNCRISHIGAFPALEDQMVMFTPFGIEGDAGADRVDALVWALSQLFPSLITKGKRVKRARGYTNANDRSGTTGY